MVKHKLPDLALKIDMARAASRATSKLGIDDQTLADFTYRRAMANPSQTFNKAVAATLYLDQPELRNLAAGLEHIVRFERSSVADVHAFADRTQQLVLYPDAIMGTVQDFAAAILTIARPEITSSLLADVAREGLDLRSPTGRYAMTPLAILGQPDRLTPPAEVRRERDIDQPDRDPLFLEPCTPLAIYVRPREEPQIVCAFELAANEELLTRRWKKAPWLGAIHQAARRPFNLLDPAATVNSAHGFYRVQAVGFDLPLDFASRTGLDAAASDMQLLPEKVADIVAGAPKHWPPGYAQMFAVRIHAATAAKTSQTRPRFYEAAYGVRVTPLTRALEP